MLIKMGSRESDASIIQSTFEMNHLEAVIAQYKWLSDTVEHYIDRRLQAQSLLLAIAALSSLVIGALNTDVFRYQFPIFVLLLASLVASLYFMRACRYLPFKSIPVVNGNNEQSVHLQKQVVEAYRERYSLLYNSFSLSGKYFRWSTALSCSYLIIFYAHLALLLYAQTKSYYVTTIFVLSGFLISSVVSYWFKLNDTSHKGKATLKG